MVLTTSEQKIERTSKLKIRKQGFIIHGNRATLG